MTDGEAKCRTCRWCISRWQHGDVEGTLHHWCVIHERREPTPCDRFQREPGTEGDDD